MEANETPPECAKREVKEETGLEIVFIRQENVWVDDWNASSLERPYLCLLENIPAHADTPAHQHIDMVFLAKPVSGTLLPGVQWFDLQEIEKLSEEEMFFETKTTIRHLLNG